MQASAAFVESIDIPQTSGLAAIRRVLDACGGGAITAERVHRITGVSVRHVGYALQSARVLGWVDRDGLVWSLTDAGRGVLGCEAGSKDELLRFRGAIQASAAVQSLAPDLMGRQPPDREAILQRILDSTELAPATARRRVQTLIAWRKQALKAGPLTSAVAPVAQIAAPSLVTSTNPAPEPTLRGLQIEGYGPLERMELKARPLTALYGAPGVGKSTALDAIWFVVEVLSGDLYAALAARHAHLEGLGHGGRRSSFSFALEFALGEHALRYEVEFGRLVSGGVGVRWERLFQRPLGKTSTSLKTTRLPRGWRPLLQRDHEGAALWRLDDGREIRTEPESASLALARPPREHPAGIESLRRLLLDRASHVELEARALASPCSALVAIPGRVDGSAFPRRVRDLQLRDPEGFVTWSEAAREILPELAFVRVAGREDRLELTLGSRAGVQLPAARLSGSALRVLALLLLAFTPGLHLVENPETGLSPEQALGVLGVWERSKTCQILFTTASPLLAERARHAVLLRRDEGGRVVAE